MALNTTLSGINAAQSDLNVISNNIANADTIGFKGSRAQFADIFAVTGSNLSSTAVGGGVAMTSVAQEFQQGDPETTGNPLDFAIGGNGFFTVNTGDGVAYTRAGAFTKDAAGNVVTPEGYNLQVYPPNPDGTFNTSTTVNLNLTAAQSAATATTSIPISANLPASATVQPDVATFSPTDPLSYNNSTTFSVFDSQGGTHSATVYYAKTGTNTWTANLTVDGTLAGSQPVTFDATGKLATPANGQLAFAPVTLTNGANPLNLSMDITKTTQFGTDYAPGAIDPSGNAAGTFSSVNVDANGIVTVTYSNNQTTQIGQLALANFANPQGLSQLGNTNWAASADSGVAVMGTSGVGQFGTVQSGQLEDSTTSDTTAQLVDMIQAQRAYQANAQALTTDNTLANALFSALR
jgi:flagellar hook protein FlgE